MAPHSYYTAAQRKQAAGSGAGRGAAALEDNRPGTLLQRKQTEALAASMPSRPIAQLKASIPVNDDKALENEADVMGAKALAEGSNDPLQMVEKNKKHWTAKQREQSRVFWEKKGKRMDRQFMGHLHRPDSMDDDNELSLNIVGDFNLNDPVTKILLQGSTRASQHQDIICITRSGKNLRFSRNNHSDTAQYGADIGRWPLIKTYLPPPKTTVRTALAAFRSTHSSIRRYDHGDCQVFANGIIKILTGQDTGFGADDNFM